MSDERIDMLTSSAVAAVTAKTHQGYEISVSVTVVGLHKIPTRLMVGCAPRQGAEGVETDPLELPEPARKWLVEIDKGVTTWLAASPENAKAFLADPLRALQQAGVRVDRAQAKAIARLRERAAAAQVVAPGLQLKAVHVTLNPGGRVPPPERGQGTWQPPKLKPDDGREHEGRS
jgi:hypothetical protein